MTDKGNWSPTLIGSLKGRRAVITGADHGLGREIAMQLAVHGCAITMLGNETERAGAVRAELSAQQPDVSVDVAFVDLADLDSVAECAATMIDTGRPIDLLVNNAGVMMLPYGTTSQGFERHFGINHLGHFALTGQLLPLLTSTPGSRVVTMASNGHKMPGLNFNDVCSGEDYNAMRAYGRSKLANLLFSQELARRLAASGYSTLSVAAHPGQSSTNPGNRKGLRAFIDSIVGQSPARGANPALRAATDPAAVSGDYYGPGGFGELRGPAVRVKPSPAALDGDLANELWKRSEDWTGVNY
ncbi:oxidoreductase [Corynebacterium sp. H113]|uniref:oxidoreductase n=1 Tax=Corynebacterium sp. H113 TaxID=3133419 RepID=UPI0030B5005D